MPPHHKAQQTPSVEAVALAPGRNRFMLFVSGPLQRGKGLASPDQGGPTMRLSAHRIILLAGLSAIALSAPARAQNPAPPVSPAPPVLPAEPTEPEAAADPQNAIIVTGTRRRSIKRRPGV